jgi:uncharacterized membrane protein
MIKAVAFCFFYSLLNVTGAVIVKWRLRGKALSSFGDWIHFLIAVQILFAFVLIFISALILFKALSIGKFTQIIPISVGINFILTVLAGNFVFEDKLGVYTFLGFGLIILGIILVTLNAPNHA